MNLAHPSFPQRRPLAGIGASLAFHGLLVALWQLSMPSSTQDDRRISSMELRLLPLPQAERRAEPSAPVAPGSAGKTPPASSPAREAVRSTPVEAVRTVPEPEESEHASPPAPPLPGASLLERARSAAGGIDRDLRQENPRRGIEAPIETRQMKLEKGIEQAAEMAPNRWYQAPKIKEIIDPGGYGRRRYRVVGAAGTYCVTYESNHAPDGIDTMQRGIQPKITSCDEDEQPATRQKWNDTQPAAPRRPPLAN